MTVEPMEERSAEVTAEEQVERIFAWRRGFNAMHLIDLGVRLGLFKSLAEAPHATAAEVAARLGLHAPYVQVWCTTAYGFGLLDADAQQRLRLAPHIDAILAKPAHPRYLGGYVRLGAQFATDDYRLAVEAFRTGSTTPFQGRSPEFTEAVAQAIAGVNVMVARKILPGLTGVADKLGGGALLEIGCGTGFLQLQIAKAFPQVRCTGVDIDPTGLAAAREAVRRAGLDQRVELVRLLRVLAAIGHDDRDRLLSVGHHPLAAHTEQEDLVLAVDVERSAGRGVLDPDQVCHVAEAPHTHDVQALLE